MTGYFNVRSNTHTKPSDGPLSGIGFTFMVPAYPGRPGLRAVKRVCVCVMVYYYYAAFNGPMSVIRISWGSCTEKARIENAISARNL